MLDILRKLGLEFGEPKRQATVGETETVRKIVAELDHLPPDRGRYVAAFAFLLSRVAHADLDISASETEAMERLVVSHGHLPEAQALIVVQMAKSQSLIFGGTENFLVAREFGKFADREQKLHLLDCLFAVSAADGSITQLEGGVIRQISEELNLDHADYVAVRSRYREYLSVLRGPAAADSDESSDP